VKPRTYLANLTSSRAAHFFIICLICGALLIVGNVALPWAPALVVVLYGSVLLYCAMVLRVPHSEMTNNSPYFLGFLFFLISLFRSFWGFSPASEDPQLGYLGRQLGGALLATICGLPFRQLLFAYSPAQADQDIFFRALEDDLRSSAAEYRRSQVELVQITNDFIEARKAMFSEEGKASRRYIAGLEKAIGIFEESGIVYPSMISSALSSCAQSLKTLQERSLELSQAAQSFDPGKLKEMVAEFTAVKERSADLAVGLGALKTTVLQLDQLAAALPSAVGAHVRDAGAEFDGVRVRLRQSLDAIQSDISAIDKVLTDFVTITQENVGLVK
jgi:hypothetical protein